MQGEFKLEIKLGNSAMQGAGQVAGALREVAAKIDRGRYDGKIMDDNGNSVGTYGFTEE